jgi:membrane protein DedA with SNARE-associated domain
MQETIHQLMTAIGLWIIAVIGRLGYLGIILLMGSNGLHPLPSEVIMPFSGYLVFTGRFTLWGAALAGALAASWDRFPPTMWAGMAEENWWSATAAGCSFLLVIWLRPIGSSTIREVVIFAARLLPVIRTFIAFPAGWLE